MDTEQQLVQKMGVPTRHGTVVGTGKRTVVYQRMARLFGTRECIVACRPGRDNTTGQTCDIKQFVHRNGNPPEKLCNITSLSNK